MEAQLHLLPTEDEVEVSWRLDDSTRAIGRRGVAEARGALRAALRHRGDDDLCDADPIAGRSEHPMASQQASAA